MRTKRLIGWTIAVALSGWLVGCGGGISEWDEGANTSSEQTIYQDDQTQNNGSEDTQEGNDSSMNEENSSSTQSVWSVFKTYALAQRDTYEANSVIPTLYINKSLVIADSYLYGGSVAADSENGYENGLVMATDKNGSIVWSKAMYDSANLSAKWTIVDMAPLLSNDFVALGMFKEGMFAYRSLIGMSINGSVWYRKKLSLAWSDGWSDKFELKLNAVLPKNDGGFIGIGSAVLPLEYLDEDDIERTLAWEKPAIVWFDNKGNITNARAYQYRFYEVRPGYSGKNCFDPTRTDGACEDPQSEGLNFEFIDGSIEQDGIYLFGNVSSTKGNGIVMVKLSQEGDIVFVKEYFSTDEVWYDLRLEASESVNGSFYLAAYKEGPMNTNTLGEYLYKIDKNGEIQKEVYLGESTYYTYFIGLKHYNYTLYLASQVVGGVRAFDTGLQPSVNSFAIGTGWKTLFSIDQDSVAMMGYDGMTPTEMKYARIATSYLYDGNYSNTSDYPYHYSLNTVTISEVDNHSDTSAYELTHDAFSFSSFNDLIKIEETIVTKTGPQISVSEW